MCIRDSSYPVPITRNVLDESHFVSGFTHDGFIAAVEQSKEYIRAGDIFQVCLLYTSRCV